MDAPGTPHGRPHGPGTPGTTPSAGTHWDPPWSTSSPHRIQDAPRMCYDSSKEDGQTEAKHSICCILCFGSRQCHYYQTNAINNRLIPLINGLMRYINRMIHTKSNTKTQIAYFIIAEYACTSFAVFKIIIAECVLDAPGTPHEPCQANWRENTTVGHFLASITERNIDTKKQTINTKLMHPQLNAINVPINAML